jgi:hypothetical protein
MLWRVSMSANIPEYESAPVGAEGQSSPSSADPKIIEGLNYPRRRGSRGALRVVASGVLVLIGGSLLIVGIFLGFFAFLELPSTSNDQSLIRTLRGM